MHGHGRGTARQSAETAAILTTKNCPTQGRAVFFFIDSIAFRPLLQLSVPEV
jgi:hypothetical protein